MFVFTRTAHEILMPRRNAGNNTIGLDANVSAQDLDRFDQLMPIHGAYTAFASESLRVLLNDVARVPGLKQAINQDIEYHLREERREGAQRTIAVRVPMDLQSKFITLFPQWGATSWLVRRMLTHYLAVVEDQGFRLHISLAASRLAAQLSQHRLF